MKTKGSYETSPDCSVWANQHSASRLLRCATGLLLALAMAATLVAAPSGGNKDLTTMNVNIYIGSGTERILVLDPTAPGYITNLIAAVTSVYYEVLASQPAVRLQAIADEIAARQPDLVAVQEATLLCNQSPGDLAFGGQSPATNVVFDYLEILMDELSARGVHYTIAVTSQEWDVELPMLNLGTGTLDDIRQTDRNAILVRHDLPPGHLRVSNPQSGTFASALTFPAIGLSVSRGWCSVDVFSRGEKLRYICAHLEEETSPQIQMAQAVELMAGLANVSMPVIISGDFNADPLKRNGVATFEAFTAAGFGDAWGSVNSSDPEGGLTWGHDEFLADPSVPFIWRLDLVLFRGNGITPVASEVIDIGLNRIEPPLWASDHAALTANFRLGHSVKATGKTQSPALTGPTTGK